MLGKNVLENCSSSRMAILRAREPFWGGEDGWLSRDRSVTDPTDDREFFVRSRRGPESPGRVQLSYT